MACLVEKSRGCVWNATAWHGPKGRYGYGESWRAKLRSWWGGAVKGKQRSVELWFGNYFRRGQRACA